MPRNRPAAPSRSSGRALAMAAALCLTCLPAAAAPRVIHDERLMTHWLTGVPTLGRGYSIRNNSLQSMCFEKVKETRPTFDFEYEIKEITSADVAGMASPQLHRVRNSWIGVFLRRHLEETKALQKQGGGAIRTLIAQVVVNTYHRAVDETGSKLDPAARQLLEDEHYSSFFTSCGFFYLRSVRSFSIYVALLQFRVSSDATADNRFIDKLQQGLLSFGGSNDGQGTMESLKQEAQSRSLRAFISAMGLAKGKSINLVPLSIEQFRETIQNAARLMEDPEAGVVSEIEVAPWVENPDVTQILSDNLKKNKVSGSLSLRTHNLEINSQLIGAIRETHDYLLSRYHLASLCEEVLYKNFPSDPATAAHDEGRYYDLDKTMFENHTQSTDESLYLSLRQFRDHFNKVPPQQILDQISAYMYGNGKTPGADDCVKQLEERRLEATDFNAIPACTQALRVRNENYMFLDDYCLPGTARISYRLPASLLK